MAKIEVSENPEFNLEMESLETTTPAHAKEWNTRYQQNLNNLKYLSNNKAKKDGSNATGTWPININGNAAKDSAGQQINTTYIKELSASGKTITYTKGNGTTDTIMTQDTVYTHPATHPGSMIVQDATHRFTTDTEKQSWNDANSKKHTHGNGSVLDGITAALVTAWNGAVSHTTDAVKHITSAERTNWNDANSKKHTHGNSSVLDGITAALVTVWNGAVNHTTDAVKHITSTERTNWNDANSKKHTHGNSSVLDGITAALVTAWNGAVTHTTDAVKHITSAERTNWNSAATHTTDAVKHITAPERTLWNTVSSKADANDVEQIESTIGDFDLNIMDINLALGITTFKSWSACTRYPSIVNWPELGAPTYITYVADASIGNYLLRFSNGAVCKATAQTLSNGAMGFKNVVWLTSKTITPPTASSPDKATDWGMCAFVGTASGGCYTKTGINAPLVGMSSTNANLMTWYYKLS